MFLIGAFVRRKPIGVALMFGAILGAVVNGDGIPVRHLVEGAFTYFDPILIIFTAMLFMRVIEENGSLGAIARLIIERLGSRPALMLTVVTLFIMFPAMLTGITTTSVLTTGALIAPVLIALGIPRLKTAAMVALVSMMGMIAPPINLLVMLIGQGVDMPYIGFEGPLLLISLPLALFVSFTTAYRRLRNADIATALEHLPRPDTAQTPLRLFLPLVVVFSIMALVRLFPRYVPDIGAPLIFIIGAAVGMLAGKKVRFFGASYRALLTALPVLGLLAGIGMFLQIMTLTGVRGLLVVTVLSLPITLTYVGLLISLPAFGGVSAFASAMVFGVPFLLSLLGRNEIVTCCGIALLAGLGDVIPPSAIEARFAAQIVGEKNFLRVVLKCLPFVAVFALAALTVIRWADVLAFSVP